MRIAIATLGVIALILLIGWPLGCVRKPVFPSDSSTPTPDFLTLMTCPIDPVTTQGDLAFIDVQLTIPSMTPMPGDVASFTFTVGNMTPPGTPNANIGMPSPMYVFMSHDNRISPSSYLVDTIPISGLNAGQSVSEIVTLTIPAVEVEPDVADVPIGTGILENGELTVNSELLSHNDWLIVTGTEAAYMRITDVIEPGERFAVEGNHPDGPSVFDADVILTHRPKYFPSEFATGASDSSAYQDPQSPHYIGPPKVDFRFIAVLDAQNCVHEADEPLTPEHERYDPTDLTDGARLWMVDYDSMDPRLNNQIIIERVSLYNPNLPDLTIEFVDRTPSGTIPQTGGVIQSRWEISNTGAKPVTTPFLTRVTFSPTETANPWDVAINEGSYPVFDDGGTPLPVPTPHGKSDEHPPLHPWQYASCEVVDTVPGNSSILEIIPVSLPYYTPRRNLYSASDESALYKWESSNPDMFATRGTDGADSYWFAVYLPIPTLGGVTDNYLIAHVNTVDPWYEHFLAGTQPEWQGWPGVMLPDDQQSRRVREADEFNNSSYHIQNGNGTLDVGFQNDLFPLDVVALDLTPTVDRNGAIWVDLRYDLEHPSDQYSVALYLSQDDSVSASDWYWNRFWWTLQSGSNNVEEIFVGTIPEAPTTGSWYVGAVIDDVFRYGLRNNDNNHVTSPATVTIQ